MTNDTDSMVLSTTMNDKGAKDVSLHGAHLWCSRAIKDIESQPWAQVPKLCSTFIYFWASSEQSSVNVSHIG